MCSPVVVFIGLMLAEVIMPTLKVHIQNIY